VGGLEKQEGSGNVSYDALNHERMVELRAAKVEAVVADVPDAEPVGDPDGDLLVIGWGSTYGAITAALQPVRSQGHRVGHLHLRHLNPFPANLGAVLRRYRKVLVPELNMGQLAFLLRGTYLVDTVSYTKMQGKPFKHSELKARMEDLLSGEKGR
jgi:2-oxoglutarate ferredoxin oxidoreductase subunit alpha